MNVAAKSGGGSHPFRPAPDRDHAGARDFDQPERQHQRDEALELVGRTGDLEHEALGAGIDDPGAKRVGETQRLDRSSPLPRTLTIANSRWIEGPLVVMSITRWIGTSR